MLFLGYPSAETEGGLQNGATADGSMSDAVGQNGGVTVEPIDLKDIVCNSGKMADASKKETGVKDKSSCLYKSN